MSSGKAQEERGGLDTGVGEYWEGSFFNVFVKLNLASLKLE